MKNNFVCFKCDELFENKEMYYAHTRGRQLVVVCKGCLDEAFRDIE